MNILSVDQSFTSSGLCVFVNGKLEKSELIKTSKDKGIYERAWDIASRILHVAKVFNVKYIGIEGLAFSKMGNATRDLAGLQFTIVTRLKFVENKNVIIVPPNTVKRVATGKGNAKKMDLVGALPKDVRESFDEMNAKKSTGLLDLTDAYWIGIATLQEIENNA